jgi:hypothetical protein
LLAALTTVLECELILSETISLPFAPFGAVLCYICVTNTITKLIVVSNHNTYQINCLKLLSYCRFHSIVITALC